MKLLGFALVVVQRLAVEFSAMSHRLGRVAGSALRVAKTAKTVKH
jgi:hypothetical protein